MTTFMTSPSLLFTSESVTEGHPDKMCDQISDAVLDAIFAQDPQARVACETAIKTGFVIVWEKLRPMPWSTTTTWSGRLSRRSASTTATKDLTATPAVYKLQSPHKARTSRWGRSGPGIQERFDGPEAGCHRGGWCRRTRG
jgi:hypothetical protein